MKIVGSTYTTDSHVCITTKQCKKAAAFASTVVQRLWFMHSKTQRRARLSFVNWCLDKNIPHPFCLVTKLGFISVDSRTLRTTGNSRNYVT
jgi:hypothetical protein